MEFYPGKRLLLHNMSHHGTWLEYFHRLLLHNWLFPDTRLIFNGFVEHESQLLPIAAQQDIVATRGATSDEIDDFMGKIGFEPIRLANPAREFDHLKESWGIEVNDLHDENVLVRTNGDLAIMDPVPMMEETSKIRRVLKQLQENAIPKE